MRRASGPALMSRAAQRKALKKSSHGKWAKKYSHGIMEKSWIFSTAYHESHTRSSDSSISIELRQ